MKYYLKNECLEVETDTLGAELTSVKAFGKERLWQNETGVWSGHAPMLFPMCGNCVIKVEGKLYDLPRHGFARRKEFRVVEHGEDYIRFSLSDDEQTYQGYPYRFSLSLGYKLRGNEIAITVTVLNTDDKEIYFSFGGHESYNMEKGNYFLRFPEEEQFIACVHDLTTGQLTGEKRLLGEGKTFDLKPEYFEGNKTVIFDCLNSRSVELCKADGTATAQTKYEGFPYLLLWSPDNADMVCIEPWLNLPDTYEEGRDIKDKGFIRLAPGEIYSVERQIKYNKER